MTDIIKMTEKTEIRPLVVPGRLPVYVYCTSYKGTRQLTRYGDVGYSSQKSHFTLLYVDEEKLDETLEQLNGLKFVKKVRVGHLKSLSSNFSEAFAQTNLEVKQEMGL